MLKTIIANLESEEMRYLFLLLLVGCGGSSNETEFIEPVEQPIVFNEVELGELTFRDVYYNGVIEHLNDNSWVFTSHTNNACVDSPNTLKSKCRKVNASYVEGNSEEGRITKISFEFNLSDINDESDLDWNIIYQDWVRLLPLPPSQISANMKNVLIDEDGNIYGDHSVNHQSKLTLSKAPAKGEYDSNGNHPITTLKLKLFDNKTYVCHYDNSWQWGFDFGDNRDGDAIDVDHTLHPENRKNGCERVYAGVDYVFELITYDYGRVVFKSNDNVITDVEYQAKHPEKEAYSQHIIQFGQYWNKGFNIENDPLNRVVIRIDDLKRYTNL